MATFECYACHATIQEGMRECVGCGAEQTKAALGVYRAQRAVRVERERWRLISATVGIVCFAVGAGFGMLAARQAPPTVPSANAVADMPVKLTVEQTNDALLRSLNETLGLGASNWVWGADSTMVLELAPPTPQQPVLWQTLSAEERQRVMAFISVAYTRTLIAAGVNVDLADNGHPPIALYYRGTSAPLAARQRDGTIRVYPSPFDRSASTPPASR